MKRLVVMTCVIACARGAAAQPAADEPIMKCHAMPPDTKIVVTFKPEIPIRDLTAWMLGFSCKTVIFGAGVKLSANVTVVAPSELTPKQAMQVYVDAVQASGYVVIQKPDTIIIKLDPKAPHECPDIADQVPTIVSPTPSVGATTRPPVPDDDLDAAMNAGVHRIDDTHVELANAMIDRLRFNPISVARSARIIAALKDGKPDGFKLYAIRPGSLLAHLGFQNGDTLLAINGFDLTSADEALEVYTKLRGATSFELAITRRGKPLTLYITIK